MLEEIPFDKITVSALVERSEIGSNTFYCHFRDIYDLLDVWMTEQKRKFLRKQKIRWRDYAERIHFCKV